ncbi:ATP-binding protein [Streptomyces sp. JJ36]|uniref:ATP-binding protein n=1 Tax=Streptomyces sp. JJ36 TaxID=2736645 RepID=UPI001F304530|nr:ATP-binding protein [Streptomyces sp. JJ36]MCF6524710.1 ATP-binding protein [Streptomyces sp. JJ36]
MPRLYGRDALLHGLLPRLVGLAHDRLRAVPREHPGALPVVLVTGRHGTGKTALLDQLAEYYEARVPCARADLERIGGPAGGRGPAVSNTSALVEVLVRLCTGLAPSVPPFGRGRFVRLLPGLFAVTSWHRGDAGEQDVARGRISRLLAALEEDRRPGETEPHVLGAPWMADVAAQLAGANPADDLEPVADAVTRQYFARHAGRREARQAQQWYGDRDEGAEDGVHALVRLCRRFHRGGDYRRAVERTLTEALLADLTEARAARRRLAQVPRPLALLDNVHTPAGRAVLDILLESRAALTTSGGSRPDPLVVVGASRETAPVRYPEAVRRRFPEVAERSGWQPPESGTPSAGVLAVDLPPLGPQDVLTMLDDAPAALDAELPTAVHRLTGGQPLGCRLLCDAVLHAPAGEPVGVEDLLRLRTAGGRPVTETLLELLVPDALLRDRLVTLAVAGAREAAHALAGAVPGGGGTAADAERYLREELWQPEHPAAGAAGAAPAGGGFFVADPFLRAVLVEEFRRTSAEGNAPAGWEEVHRVLREHHAALGEAGEPDVLRHTLAAGEAWSVVLRLAGAFGEADAGRWLACLGRAVTAPHPPWGPPGRDPRPAVARGERDAEHADADDLHRSVNRLLHAAWYTADTVGTPSEELRRTLERELDFLSLHHPTGHAVLSRAARDWAGAAGERRSFPP